MIASNNEVHDNLVELTNRMNGGTNEDVHDDLKGVAALAGNEGEAEIADAIQTLSFSTWISDICDGLKQEKQLERETPEYNQTASEIRESIQNINYLGKQMGMEKEVIPTPANGHEAEVAAQAVYNCVALPYEAGANVDYSKYIQAQELNNEVSRSMKRLSYAVAQNDQYGKNAKAYWDAATDTSKHQNSLTNEFLGSINNIKEYEKWIKEQKEFLDKEEELGESGLSSIQMGGGVGGKVDFEGDDVRLQENMRKSVAKAENLIKTEKAMLQAGHIDSKRRRAFESTIKDYVTSIKRQRQEIQADDIADMEATAKLEKQIKSDPDSVSKDSEEKYTQMVLAQKNEAPTLDIKSLTKYAKEIKLGVEAMNVGLIASGITPMQTSSLNMMQMLQIGKFIYDVHDYVKDKNKDAASIMPEMKTKQKTEDAIEKEKEDPSVILNIKRKAKAVKKNASMIAENFRTALRNMLQFDEEAPDYEASGEMVDQVEHLVGDVVNTEEFENEDAKMRQQSQSLMRLQNVIQMGTGDNIFDKDVQDMSSEELDVNANALKAVMVPMNDGNGRYLKNFADCYAIGLPEMPEMQKEYTEAATDLMIIGQPEAALAVRESQTQLIDLSQQYEKMYGNKDLTHVEDTSKEDEKIQEEARKAEEKKQHMIDVYKPLLMKVGVMTASSAYHKHEFNKAWREAINERNLKVACQGTMQYMQESQEESKRLSQDFWHGPHGLLR